MTFHTHPTIQCMGIRSLLGTVMFACCWLTSPGSDWAEQARAAPPNVVVILADDMGYGDPGCYNADSKCPTPHLDRMAAQGMRFTDAHAAGAWCTPSRYGLMTGRYAFRTDLSWRKQAVIQEGTTTVADTLKTAGYTTAMVGKWHLGFDAANQWKGDTDLTGGPCDRGFDTFFGLPASLDIPDYYWIHDRHVPHPPTIPIQDSQSDGWSPIQGNFYRGGLRGADFRLEEVLDRIGEEATRKVRNLAKQDRPYFLYVPLTSPHTPWIPAKQYASANGAGMYSQFVSHTDAVIGKILAGIDESGEREDTLVVFASDNGPVWYEYDKERFGHDSMGGWRGMKGDVWEAGHRIPFLVRWPKRIAAGTVNDQLISFVDLHATLAEFAGVAKPDSAVDSLSFATNWTGGSNEIVRSELVCFQDPVALRSHSWKLVLRAGSLGFLSHRYRNGNAFRQQDELNPKIGSAEVEPAGQLYDLSRDPGEKQNLWHENPQVVEKLTELLEQQKRE